MNKPSSIIRVPRMTDPPTATDHQMIPHLHDRVSGKKLTRGSKNIPLIVID